MVALGGEDGGKFSIFKIEAISSNNSIELNMTKLPLMWSLFAVAIICTLLSSCGMTTETTHDPRFEGVFGRQINTKRWLRLYRIDSNLTGDSEHHCVTAGYFPFTSTDSGEIGILPRGHPVQFNKLKVVHSVDGGDEFLLGTTTFKGISYPISYRLGLVGDDTNAGWRRIYLSFEIPRQK